MIDRRSPQSVARAPEESDADTVKSLLESLAHARTRRGVIGAAALARSTAETQPAMAALGRRPVSSEMRAPTEGPTDVVTVRPVVEHPPSRRIAVGSGSRRPV